MNIPESREVWEHGEREFDRRDAALGRAAMGAMVVVVVLGLLLVWVLTR